MVAAFGAAPKSHVTWIFGAAPTLEALDDLVVRAGCDSVGHRLPQSLQFFGYVPQRVCPTG